MDYHSKVKGIFNKVLKYCKSKNISEYVIQRYMRMKYKITASIDVIKKRIRNMN